MGISGDERVVAVFAPGIEGLGGLRYDGIACTPSTVPISVLSAFSVVKIFRRSGLRSLRCLLSSGFGWRLSVGIGSAGSP